MNTVWLDCFINVSLLCFLEFGFCPAVAPRACALPLHSSPCLSVFEGNRLLTGKAEPWAKAWQRAERKNFLDGLKRLTHTHNSCICTQREASWALKTIVTMTTGLKQGMWEPVTRKGLHMSTGNRPQQELETYLLKLEPVPKPHRGFLFCVGVLFVLRQGLE